MPLGPEYDDYKMALHARIIDTLGGVAIFDICNIRVRGLFNQCLVLSTLNWSPSGMEWIKGLLTTSSLTQRVRLAGVAAV